MAATSNVFDLTGKTALVTGGGYGLGRGLVHGLAAHGARVIGTARSAEALADTFSTLGPEHRYIVGDLTGDALYEELDQLDVPIDILVNNAGGDPRIKPWPHQTPDDWRYTYEVNVVAAERLIHLLAPKMAERGWGRVINVSSVYGSLAQDMRNTTATGGAGAYTAAKHGLIGLTHFLASQLGRTGVTVNTLSPGMITWDPNPSDEARELWAQLADKTPVGRTSLPDDYVAATVFLASEGASFVHGHNLVVDGGWSIW